jgi:hypothetical protein
MNMTSEILNDYNRQLGESEICYKNNRDNQHDWEQINTQQISMNIIELEYYCCLCSCIKYTYSYIEEDQL